MKKWLCLLLGWLLPFTAFSAASPIPQSFSGGVNVLNPPAIQNGTDVSIHYLQNIFGVVDGVLHGSGSQILGTMFSVFNAAVLVLGVIIVMYTTILSVMNTANEGEVLGKKYSSVWVPIRSILGIALLIPKATGYSAIQIFMMWVIVQGVAAADSIWDAALKYLYSGGVIVQQPLELQGSVGNSAKSILKNQVCMLGLQAILDKRRKDLMSQGVNVPPVPNLAASLTPFDYTKCQGYVKGQPFTAGSCKIDLPNDLSAYSSPTVNFNNLRGLCGMITVELKDPQNTSNQLNNYVSLISSQQLVLDLQPPAGQAINNAFAPDLNSSTNTIRDLSPYIKKNSLLDAIADYQGISLVLKQSMKDNNAANLPNQLNKASKRGWILAGNYYQDLVNLNKQSQSTNFSGPSVDLYLQGENTTPTPRSIPGVLGNSLGAYSSAGLASEGVKLLTYMKAWQGFFESLPTSSSTYGGKETSLPNLGNSIFIQLSGFGSIMASFIQPGLGPLIQIITAFISLASAQNSNANPVVIMAFMGGAMIEMVVQLWIWAAIGMAMLTAALAAVPSVNLSNAITNALLMVIPLMFTFSLLLLTNGILLAFYIPLIPFMLFLFGAIGWIIAVIESMVAAPLVALGITHPEGSEILGKADPAVLLLVNVFLRPSMMIIGLIAGIILSYVGIWLLNEGFFETFTRTIFGSVALLPFTWLFAIPAMLLMYTIIAIGLVNKSFELINVIPDRVLRWLGFQGESVAEQAKAGAQEVKGGLQQGAEATGKGVQGAIEGGAGKGAKFGGQKAGAKGGNQQPGGAAPSSDVQVSETSSTAGKNSLTTGDKGKGSGGPGKTDSEA